MKELLFIPFLLLSAVASAEECDSIAISKIGIEVRYTPAQTLCIDKEPRIWTKTKETHAIAAQLNITPTENNFARDYNYPTFSVGLRYNLNHGTTMHKDTPWGEAQPVDYTSKLGNFLTLYGTFNRPLYRSKHWQWGYYLGTGVGYTSLKYNQKNNIDNEYIGSHLNIFFTAGLYGQYKVAREWSIKAGLDFAHHSNGAMARPNKGANYLGPFLTHLLYRYARRWASGVGFGLFYGDYISRVAQHDKEHGYTGEKHSPWSLSIEGRHEIFYGNMSVRVSLGYYLYRHMGYKSRNGLERPYHEQVGVFYSFPKLKNLTLGFSVNAHATKADFTELQITMPVRL